MLLRVDLHARESDGFVAWAPMFHMGSTDQVFGSLMSGATVHVVDGFDAERIVTIMEEAEIGWMILMPGSIEPVVELLKATGRKPKGIRAVGAMADLVPLRLIAELTGLTNAPYLNSFGATETGSLPHRRACCRRASCRPPFPSGEAPSAMSGWSIPMAGRSRTANPARWPCGDRRSSADTGMRRRPMRGISAAAGSGWATCSAVNADGSFDFVDRAKYMIKSGGENIYPAEIERVLLSDPRITDAIVVRMRDDRWGEVPVAFVSRADSELTSEEIETLCRKNLAGYKRPKAIHFIGFDEFPRSTTGKIMRHEMEARLRGT